MLLTQEFAQSQKAEQWALASSVVSVLISIAIILRSASLFDGSNAMLGAGIMGMMIGILGLWKMGQRLHESKLGASSEGLLTSHLRVLARQLIGPARRHYFKYSEEKGVKALLQVLGASTLIIALLFFTLRSDNLMLQYYGASFVLIFSLLSIKEVAVVLSHVRRYRESLMSAITRRIEETQELRGDKTASKYSERPSILSASLMLIGGVLAIAVLGTELSIVPEKARHLLPIGQIFLMAVMALEAEKLCLGLGWDAIQKRL